MTKEITKTKLLDIAVVKTHTGQITIKPLVQVLEDFKVDENGPIKLKVELVELIGANTLIHGKLENSEEILVASIAGVVSESKIGKNIGLSFDESKLHLFDMNSDQRIN